MSVSVASLYPMYIHDCLSPLLPGCSTPKQYNVAADFTLSAKKKRKLDGTEEGEGVEPAGGEGDQQGEKAPVGKKRKRSAVQADTAEQEEGEEEVKTPVTKKHKKIKKERDFDFSAEGNGVATMETPVAMEATDDVEMEVNVVVCACVHVYMHVCEV